MGIAEVDGRHVLVVGSWDSAVLDFYQSNGKPLHDPRCRFSLTCSWIAQEADRTAWSDPAYGSYQNLNLITGESGQLFLAAFCREDSANVMDLYAIRSNHLGDSDTKELLTKLSRKAYVCRHTSFQSGAGISMDANGALRIDSCGHRSWIVESFKPAREETQIR